MNSVQLRSSGNPTISSYTIKLDVMQVFGKVRFVEMNIMTIIYGADVNDLHLLTFEGDKILRSGLNLILVWRNVISVTSDAVVGWLEIGC